MFRSDGRMASVPSESDSCLIPQDVNGNLLEGECVPRGEKRKLGSRDLPPSLTPFIH